jgi:serine/threonine protein phosphatase PrpC
MAHDCDAKLRASGVDVTNSGSTAILVLKFGDTLYSGSVGDSRAIIACSKAPESLPTEPAILDTEERKSL